MTKTIAGVVGFAAADGGHAIEVEVELADATRERLRCGEHMAPALVQALTQAYALAERERETGHKQLVLVEMPYRATGVAVGITQGAPEVAIRFATAEGVPVVVTLPPALAREAINGLTAQLARLSNPAPPRRH